LTWIKVTAHSIGLSVIHSAALSIKANSKPKPLLFS